MQKRSLKQKCLAWVLSLAVAMTFIPLTAGFAFAADGSQSDPYFINLEKANNPDAVTGDEIKVYVNFKEPWQSGNTIVDSQFYTGDEMKPEVDNINCKMGIGDVPLDAKDDSGNPYFSFDYGTGNWTDQGDYTFKVVSNPDAGLFKFTRNETEYYAKFTGEYTLVCSITPPDPKNLRNSTVTFSEGTVDKKTGYIQVPYDGQLHQLVPAEVKDLDNNVLVQDVDYEVSYPSGSTNAYRKVGEFEILISAKEGNANNYIGSITKIVSITDVVQNIAVFSQKGLNGERTWKKNFSSTTWGNYALTNPLKWGYGKNEWESSSYIPVETLFTESGLAYADTKDMIDIWTNSDAGHYFNAPKSIAELQTFKYAADGQEVLSVFGGEFTIPAFLVLDTDSASAKPRGAVGGQEADSKPAGNMSPSAVSEIALVSMDINGLSVSTPANAVYAGKAITPTVSVKDGSEAVPVTLAYKNNNKAGTATVTVTAKADSDYYGTVTKTFKIAKGKNTLTVKTKAAKVKKSKVKKKAQKLAAKKVMTVSKAQGKVTYAKVSGNKKLSIAKNGTVTVKKKTKKGTYKMKVKVTAAGNANYKAGSKIVNIQVKVK